MFAKLCENGTNPIKQPGNGAKKISTLPKTDVNFAKLRENYAKF